MHNIEALGQHHILAFSSRSLTVRGIWVLCVWLAQPPQAILKITDYLSASSKCGGTCRALASSTVGRVPPPLNVVACVQVSLQTWTTWH